MKIIFICIFISIILFSIACDVENLLKTTEPPQVSDIMSSEPGFVVQPTQAVKFWVEASDPEGGVLTYEWTASAGAYIGSRQTDTLEWRAPVTGGQYVISVKVSNADKDVTRSKEILVPSLTAPQVSIISPLGGEFITQQNTVLVQATAISENGIFQTDFFVNDSLVSSLAGATSNSYIFNWLVREAAGQAKLKVSATARQTGLTGADSLIVNVEGIIPGKQNAR